MSTNPPFKAPITIAGFGASTTRGWRPGLHNYQTFRLLFEKELCDRGIPAVFMDAAQPGNTSIGAQQRFERDVLTPRPDAVVIDIGINDSSLKPDGKTPRVSVTTYEEIYLYWITTLKAQGTPTVLVTPQPFSKPEDGEKNGRLEKYVETTRRLGREHGLHVVDCFTALLTARDQGEDIDKFYLDGIHLNAAGNRFVADLLVRFEEETGFFARISQKKNSG